MNIRDLVLYFALKYEGDFNRIYNALSNKEKFDGEALCKMKEQLDCQYISIFDEEYPSGLRKINCPPFVLFYKGNIDLLDEKKLCLITPESNHSTQELLNQFVDDMIEDDEFVLVKPHRSSLDDYAVKTIKIMDRGISFYGDVDNINTLVFSEYPYYVEPPKKYLPFSYRIVSGLADKIVMAQCYDTNEDIMALAYAIEQNKDVYMIGNEYELYDILNQQKIKHIENYGELESAV